MYSENRHNFFLYPKWNLLPGEDLVIVTNCGIDVRRNRKEGKGPENARG